MKVNSIPIYWGNPIVNKEFNTKSFINWYDYKSPNEMIEHIKELDQDDNKYMEMLRQPWFENNEIPKGLTEENIKSFLYKIFESNGSN